MHNRLFHTFSPCLQGDEDAVGGMLHEGAHVNHCIVLDDRQIIELTDGRGCRVYVHGSASGSMNASWDIQWY